MIAPEAVEAGARKLYELCQQTLRDEDAMVPPWHLQVAKRRQAYHKIVRAVLKAAQDATVRADARSANR